MQLGSYQNYVSPLGLVITGAVLWIIGVLIDHLLPVVGVIGGPVAIVGTVLFYIGIIWLIVSIIVGLLRGA